MDDQDIYELLKRCEVKKKKRRVKTLDLIIFLLAVFMFLFICTMIYIFWVKGSVPDTLITCVMGGGAVEAISTAWITVAKKKYMKDSEVHFDELDN